MINSIFINIMIKMKLIIIIDIRCSIIQFNHSLFLWFNGTYFLWYKKKERKEEKMQCNAIVYYMFLIAFNQCDCLDSLTRKLFTIVFYFVTKHSQAIFDYRSFQAYKRMLYINILNLIRNDIVATIAIAEFTKQFGWNMYKSFTKKVKYFAKHSIENWITMYIAKLFVLINPIIMFVHSNTHTHTYTNILNKYRTTHIIVKIYNIWDGKLIVPGLANGDCVSVIGLSFVWNHYHTFSYRFWGFLIYKYFQLLLLLLNFFFPANRYYLIF